MLYVNLEPLAVTEYLYPDEVESGMEEVLLSYDEENESSMSVLLNAIKKNSDGVYVLTIPVGGSSNPAEFSVE